MDFDRETVVRKFLLLAFIKGRRRNNFSPRITATLFYSLSLVSRTRIDGKCHRYNLDTGVWGWMSC